MQTEKEKGVYKKIEDLRIWVAYLKGNTMCISKDADVEEVIGWVDSEIKNPVPSQTLEKWVGDVLNMQFVETIFYRITLCKAIAVNLTCLPESS